MFKSTKEFDKAIYNILSDINNSVSIDEIKNKFSETEFDDAFEHCYNHNLINGIQPEGRTISGNYCFTILDTGLRLTYKGLSFIENFNQ